jgi:serine protease
MKSWVGLLLVAVGLLGSCPLDIHSTDENGSTIGAPCSDHQDCVVGWCETKEVDGYCLMDCQREACPDGSRCVVFDFGFGIQQRICLRSCQVNADCGRPGYFCVVPPDQGAPVCQSAGTTQK